MILNDVHEGIQKHRPRKRIGRGLGSGTGKTAGKGMKGYFARSGSPRRLGFEGGQVTMARRIAKRGFSNAYFAKKVAVVNVGAIEELFEAGSPVTPETLVGVGIVQGHFDVIKILGDGELTKRVTVTAHRFSKSAIEAIEKAGGTVTVIHESV
ncbi:MAG: 50S ribosomal protein L15 [Planctomycetaceae bacterium]|jgi:large subunit ribosomal protein L15|nr:50S ribosomal protein L15 [Planctomycetaceae bacterium]